jgi:hypothetical protein
MSKKLSAFIVFLLGGVYAVAQSDSAIFRNQLLEIPIVPAEYINDSIKYDYFY